MKTIITILLYLFTALLSSGIAQPHAILSRFTGYQHNHQIELQWTFIGGSQCDGTFIQRSSNGTDYTLIGHIPGICGSPGSATTYTFADTLPITNSINHYRLELGYQGYTTPIQVSFYQIKDEVLIHGNPLINTSTIIFNNPAANKVFIQIFSATGRKIFQTQTRERSLTLHRHQLPPNSSGLCSIIITYQNKISSRGKIMVW